MNHGTSTLILGIGNLLRSDDGLGVHVIRELQTNPPPGCLLVDGGTAIASVLAYVEKAKRVLLIDAVQGGQPAGTIHQFALTDGCADESTDQTPGNFVPGSLHSLDLVQSFRLLSPGEAMPSITVLGVEPANLSYGLELSPQLRGAVPRLINLIQELTGSWRSETNQTEPAISSP